MQKMARNGVHFEIGLGECTMVSRLDAMKMDKKKIYGGELLISEKAAAENDKEKRCRTYVLSEREKEIIKRLA